MMHIFCTGLVKRLVGVCTTTVLTNPSFPGKSSQILPSPHAAGGKFSLASNTNWPILMFSFSFRHFFRSWSVDRYSLFQRSQKFCSMRWRSRIKRAPTVPFSGPIANGGGKIVGSPIKKCPGVKACMSFGSSLSGCSGREFRIASICASNVTN